MGKNIVLFSDGTGNSSASPFKTNVWRLYQAIDIEPPTNPNDRQQIVYYDNGVGTENFKPLAALGGALGIGVWQNVKDLYTFVCRNYDIGDQIYGFGFSRGAFTIRLLMGLIGRCGHLKDDSEADLADCVQMAYEAYRRDFLIRASTPAAHDLSHHRLREPRCEYRERPARCRRSILASDDCHQLFPDIRFLGVWDTVDAYGMPVDELKLAIDEWVWPMSFADRDPSKMLLTIRHALSLDDERPTFRPVLWNEVWSRTTRMIKRSGRSSVPIRIQQVWFAGVHANVGGGYPDDGLAFTTLNWMMDEAHAVGLRYDRLIRDEIAAHENPDGEQYDSRSGIAGYYRYGPRQVGALCDDKDHGVNVPTVNVHPAAFERIFAWRRDYEPVSLDCPFSVGGVAKAPADAAAVENAWDIVWWRRFAYFTTLTLTAFVGLFALRLVFAWPECILTVTEAWLEWGWSFVTAALGATVTGWIVTAWNWLLDHIGSLLPGWASPTVPSFQKYPLSGIVSLVLLAWAFFCWSKKLEQRIEVPRRMGLGRPQGPGCCRAAEIRIGTILVARALRPVTALALSLALARDFCAGAWHSDWASRC